MSSDDDGPGLVQRVRDRYPFLDHLVRAYQRFDSLGGNRLAAAVTYFGFLSFFPVIALAVGILTFVTSGNDAAVADVVRAVDRFSPGLADALELPTLLSDPAVAGTATGLGALGLLIAGTGWVDSLREALRVLWHQSTDVGNIVLKKGKDVLILAGLGATLLASVVVSGFATSGTRFVLGFVELEDSLAATAALRVLGVLLPLAVDVVLFLYLFTRLATRAVSWREVWRGAVLGAVLFEVLKGVGSVYIARTTSNPVYGTFAVAIGLLVWINLVSRVSLLVAAWTVTAPGQDDVVPSGTARLPSGPSGRPSDAAGPAGGLQARVVAPGGTEGEVRGAARVRTAARVVQGVLAAAAVGVAVHAVRTVAGLRQD